MTQSDQPPAYRSRSSVRRAARRTAVATAGGALLLVGAAMLVLPGPGLLVVTAGLAVLATEFAWARRRLDQAKQAARTSRAATASVLRRGQRDSN